MDSFLKNVEIRWADLDPNFHLRHSVYYDYGASARIEYLQQYGITAQFMYDRSFGPVILREECIFKKEIRSTDAVTINVKLEKARADYSRWSIGHTIYKNNNIVSALLTIDGAWIDTLKRKLIAPPEEVFRAFEMMPKDERFEWLLKK